MLSFQQFCDSLPAFGGSEGSYPEKISLKQLINSPRFAQRVGRSTIGVVAAALLFATAAQVRAADPAFVGVLALATNDATAQRLGLSDEVKEQLRKLVEQRENAAIDLALSIKDLPPEERARRLAPFVEESERLGMQLLSMKQRSTLSQLHLQQKGMTSLAEPTVVKLLELDEQQQAEIRRLLAERAEAMTRGGQQERRLTQLTYERRLQSVLNKTQKATWQQMAGLGPGPVADSLPPSTDVVASAPTDPAAADTAVTTASENPPEAKPAVEPAAAEAGLPAAEASTAQTQSGAAATTPTQEQMSTQNTASGAPATAAAQQPVSPSDTTAPATLPQANVTAPAADADVQQPEEGAPRRDPEDIKLRFNFRFQPWEEVLDWLAEQADLSLQSALIPEGTFNYSDQHSYTPTEAIDLINGVLLTQGYTLVRRGRLLTVINLDDEVPDVLVEFVPVEQLDERGEFELVKTVFHLAKMEPSDAEQEIGQLLGPGRSMVVMPKARQILVTETAGKLRTIRDVIERAENPTGAKDKGVTEFKLAYVSPEEVLLIARPLLGLNEGENVGEEISIAQDTTGTRLFAAGGKDKIQILEDLVQRVDVQRAVSPTAVASEQPQLMTHSIRTADSAEALAVMQTLLAGLPDVRMSLDPKTNKIIALARPSEHKTIQETIRQLEGEAPRIEVIQLRKIDPQLAVLTIGKFFTEDSETASTIKIDADPTTMKLYVRATDTEIEQIKQLIEKLEGPAEGGSNGGNLRFIPLTGGSAESAVETVRRLWLGPNRIQLTAPSESGPSIFDLREVNPETPSAPQRDLRPATPSARLQPPGTMHPASTQPSRPAVQASEDKVTLESHSLDPRGQAYFGLVSWQVDEPADETTTVRSGQGESEIVTAAQEAPQTEPGKPEEPAKTNVKDSDIRIEFTPNGVLITSEDTEALDKFEDLLRTVAGPTVLTPGKNFTVYFLKFCKADVASQLIQDILGGTSSDGGGGSLVGDVAANLMGGGGILGALLGGGATGGGGGITTVQATGPVSIVADSRLNCLVVQALPVDLQLIEQLLKVIDREGSITDIQTAGKPHIIPIIYMNATQVANVLREAYANRIATNNSQGRGGQPNPADLIRALRGGRGGGATEVKSEEAKMTIAVDTTSNSLIVTAPDQLYQEVKELVYQIDQSGVDQQEEVQVVSVKNANPEAVQKALAAIMGQRASGSSSRSSSSSSPTGVPGGGGMPFGGASAGDIQARIDFFRRMQGGGGFPGAGGPGGGGGFQPRGIQPGGGGSSGRGGFQPGGGGFGGRGGTPGGSSQRSPQRRWLEPTRAVSRGRG